ncbi:hypothetical protein [Phaeovulum sp. W22_SRMD_FR3]|uniref:hypothetical protein n=1 Tax=Phaeovulum sp. W22_SRMD_FR3 TaxID=3240274 RepID=UPI003F96BD5B
MKMIDPDHPFFAPMWRRVLTTVLPILWGGVELATGNPGWALIFAGAGAYAGWELIVKPRLRG